MYVSPRTGAGLLRHSLTHHQLSQVESIIPPCRAGLLIRIFQLYMKHTDSQDPPRDSDLWREARIGVLPRFSEGTTPWEHCPRTQGSAPALRSSPAEQMGTGL